MALDVLDGNGAEQTVKTTLSGQDHVPHHHVDSSALPSGAATQTTLAAAVTELQSILSKLNAAFGALGQTTMAGSAPVTIASNQTVIPVSDNSSTLSVDDGGGVITVDGTVSVTGVATEATLATVATEATLAGVLTTTAFQARVPANGQAAMAASIPVVVASNQTVIPISDNGTSITVDGAVAVTANYSNGTNYINNAATTGSITPSNIDCQLYNEAVFHLLVPHASDPVGYFEAQGSINGTDYYPAPISAVIDTSTGIAIAQTGVTHSTGTNPHRITLDATMAANLDCWFGFDSPPAYMRVRYVRTSGGSASGTYLHYFLRSI